MTKTAETAQLLARLRTAVNANHRLRRRRLRVGITVVASLLVLTGVAAATQAPWWDSGSPPVDPSAVASVAKDNMPAKVDLSRARTVAQTDGAALVAVPLDETGYCLIPTLGGRGDLGAQCEYQVENPQQGNDDRLESYAQPATKGAAAWIVYGRVTDPRAAALDLGAFTVQLATGGFFLASVPEGSWAALDGKANPGKIVDSSGGTLRTGCVNWGPSPGSPDAGKADVPLWQDGGGPCKPISLAFNPATLDFSQAEKVFDFGLTADFSIWKAGETIAFWQAPASDGRQCIFPGPTSGPDTGFPYATGDCRDPSAAWPAPEPAIQLELNGGRIHVDGEAGYDYAASGRVNPSSGIARMELHSAAGSTAAAFGGGYFFVQLPGTSASADALPDGGPFTVVGYDDAGRQVASASIDELFTQARPH